jgi:hypothetical protein
MFHVAAAAAASSMIASSHHHHFFQPILQHAAVSTRTTTASSTALATLRGGHSNSPSPSVGGEPVLEISRIGLRLDGLNSYAVISTLLMNACLGLYSSTRTQLKDISHDTVSQKVAKVMFMFSTVISIFSSSYTTVVFTLLGLYSKTALGSSQDGPFLEFFAQTAIFRQLAFTAFCISLVSFQICFLLSLFLTNEGFVHWYVTGLASVLSMFCFWQWGTIINLAGRLLFKKK